MGDELGSARTSEDASADATDMERTCPATSWCSCGSQWPYASCLEPASRQLHKDPTVAVSLIFLLMLHHRAADVTPLCLRDLSTHRKSKINFARTISSIDFSIGRTE